MALVSTQGSQGAIHRTATPLQRGVCLFAQVSLEWVHFEEKLGLQQRRAPVRPAGCKNRCPIEIVPRKTKPIHFRRRRVASKVACSIPERRHQCETLIRVPRIKHYIGE